ncbi:MAG: hypothetical protein HY834_05580 [Devosia nanyangense]|uniref:Uncharacterized protein n=1 Tax=Devosia nanyangense TaxID=1228055 RepID=A0A933NVU1_9HYPH|nr:hypothetical protein [Devosia nanyangense]
MNEADRKARNVQRLQELYPTFAARVAQVIAALEARHIRPRIQDAWRSIADQKAAFDAGHSKVLFGFHNVTGAGGKPESLAVDMLDDDSPLALSKSYLLQLADAAEQAGLITGIRWGVPEAMVGAIDAAIASQNWTANVKIGWDPSHIQPVGISIDGARNGKRPK